MKLNKKQREELRTKFGGKCAYCGCELPEKGWHADHLEPVEREWWKKDPQVRYDLIDGKITRIEEKLPMGMQFPERDCIENMMPSCRACNIDKHATALEFWRKQMEGRVNVCRRNYSAFRHAERFGLIVEIQKPVVFWFERYTAETKSMGVTA